MKSLILSREELGRALAAIAAAEAGPTPSDLAGASVLNDWQPRFDAWDVPVLWGDVTGHPNLDDQPIATSRLIAIAPAVGWARTINRWYRLGRPVTGYEIELARSVPPNSAGAGDPGVDGLAELARVLADYIAAVRRYAARNSSEGTD